MVEEIIEEIEEEEEMEEEPSEVVERSELNLQKFMDDMSMIGDQVKSKELVKPNFHYGDLSISNYLLWLILGELMMLNDKLDGGSE